MQAYEQFLEEKSVISDVAKGFEVENIHPKLFPFQRDLVRWALRKGRSAFFTGTGTGKTFLQGEWAKHVHQHTGGNVLILAPLAVSNQTVRELEKIDLKITLCESQSDVKKGINITNYEKLHKFDVNHFSGVVLDESSILKAFDGKTRTNIIESFERTPYRLACTATPAPNDFMELGNHAEFLGVMSYSEMLSMFFVHDGGDTSKWRLKGHAEDKFWEWVASWAAVLNMPSDLGYSDKGFILPPLNIHEVVVKSDKEPEGTLFNFHARTLMERRRARRDSIEERVKVCADIVNSTNKPFLVWCDLNRESELLTQAIHGAVEVKGSDSSDHKEKAMIGFSNGDIRVLVTKPSISGFGMNWQHCSDMAFVGVSDSFEQYFQAVRRCWRFGQKNEVNVHVIISDLEGAVRQNLLRKEEDANKMIREMVEFTKEFVKSDIESTSRITTVYDPTMEMEVPEWLVEEI